MKRNTELVFRHSFGQLLQNVPPISGMVSILWGNGRCYRSASISQDSPLVLNDAVHQWRLNSLRGVTGVPCPTKRKYAAAPDDYEVRQLRLSWGLPVEPLVLEPTCCKNDDVDGRWVINPAWRETGILATFNPTAVQAIYNSPAPYNPDELLRRGLGGLHIIYRRQTDGTCRLIHLISTAQAFAMLGGWLHR